jgi:NAD(P) transhydrogenase
VLISNTQGERTIEELVTASHTLIAVGTRPFHPQTVPFDHTAVHDSDSIIRLGRVPRSLTVVGAGVIGLEYATIFNALDVPVTLIEPRSSILEFMDAEVVENFVCQLRDGGMAVRLGSPVASVELDDRGWTICKLENGRQIRSEVLLYAAGRIGATDKLGLELCGIATDHRGRITVNPETYQTTHPDIYAAGDVIGFPSLASTSMEQGRLAACHAFDMPLPSTSNQFPLGIYAVPEMSSVGLTEQAAQQNGIAIECGIARLRETSRGHIMGLSAGFLKLVFALDSKRLLGVHIVGEGATELIHIGQAVINLKGTLDYFVENSFNYPTLAEAYKIAALDAWNRMNIQIQVKRPKSSKLAA